MNRLSAEDSMVFACYLAKKLAADLDAGDRSSINLIGELLSELPLEAFLIATRTYLGLERIVQHNLDKKPFKKTWEKLLKSLGDTNESV